MRKTVVGIVLSAMTTLAVLPADPAAAQEAAMPSLAQRYAPFFRVGAAVKRSTLVTHADLLLTQVNSLVCENAMKWEAIHPVPGDGEASYRFADADAIVAFAAEHEMTMRGHTLVWHQQVPEWVFRASGGGLATKAEVLGRMQSHIQALLSRYRGMVSCWDVVNEALSDGPQTWREDSGWHRTAGSDDDGDGVPDYIVRAFQCAREADPSARLFYNDYGIESGVKRERAYTLAKTLKARGLIDGVGIQGHWSILSPDERVVQAAIERFSSLGLAVEITELDLSVYSWGDASSLADLPPGLERVQASRYGALFGVFRRLAEAGKLQAVTFWGIADDQTWLDNFPVKGRKDWPLLFDVGHRPKLAFWSVVRW
jgi:endo-1,4-beta-xylanase